MKNIVLTLSIIIISLTINSQTWSEVINLTASDAEAGDLFGLSVSISGSQAVVGAYDESDGKGAAYIYKLEAGNWIEKQKITASDGSFNDHFSISVSIFNDYIIVGASGNDENGLSAGAAYIFELENDIWVEKQKIVPSDIAVGDAFGFSVSISNNKAIIGSQWDDDNGNKSGSAYVFVRESNVWMEEGKLTPDDGVENDQFGIGVAISGDHAIVGANQDDDNGENSGSAYIFEFVNDSWTEVEKLLGSTSQMDDEFGRHLAIDGDLAIVGAFLSSDEGAESGSAYIFGLEAGNWVEKQKLVSSDLEEGDRFGSTVSISGDKVIIGAYRNDDDASNSGSAYIFSLNDGTWVEDQILTVNNLIENDFFGFTVSISGDNVIISSWTDGAGLDSGSAFIFNNTTNTSTNDLNYISLKAFPNPNNGDFYISNVNNLDQIRIYSLEGKIIKVKTLVSQNKVEFNDLNEGVYFIELVGSNGNNNKMIKIIVE